MYTPLLYQSSVLDPLRARARRGEGLVNLAVYCISADQLDFTEAIRFNYIHIFAVALLCCVRVASCTCEIEIKRAVLRAREDGVQVLGCLCREGSFDAIRSYSPRSASVRTQSSKQAQLEAVKEVIQGGDTFVNVPTGYGKSFVYQVLPFCASFILERLGKAGKTPTAVLVVSPLQRIPAFTADYDGSDVHKSCSTRSFDYSS